MLTLSPAVKLWYCPQPTNMGLGFDGLYARVQNLLKADPLSGHLFLFANRSRNRIKVLYWGGHGLCLWSQRLEKGRYHFDDWSRLKGRPLGLVPMYLTDERRMQGLVYLLSLALRLLSLLEWVVRERLREDGAKLQGIYAGQPGRKTDRPSAELLLGAMKTISVSVVEAHGQLHALLSPLTEVQKRLLDLWGLPADLYEKVAYGFPRPPTNTSEP